jgi:RHS repeat-associated protein
MYSDGAYAPFGEAYAQTGTADLSFTGMNQDTVAGLYDFPAREYNNTQGRWPSPDPLGIRATSLRNPQSWNRYAYVLNIPMSNIDPTGLLCQKGEMCSMGFGGDFPDDFQVAYNVDPVDFSFGASLAAGFQQGAYSQQDLENFVIANPNLANVPNLAADLPGLFLAALSGMDIDAAVESQKEALAEKLSEASNNPDITWDDVYNGLNPYVLDNDGDPVLDADGNPVLNIKGGNVDFTWQSDDFSLADLSLNNLNVNITGTICNTCRIGGILSVHWTNDAFHLDTANPFWGLGLGLLTHGFVDYLIGNLNPNIPINR